MADKKASKVSKALGKKDMKKTKGGMNFAFGQLPAVQSDLGSKGFGQKVSPGSFGQADGSV